MRPDLRSSSFVECPTCRGHGAVMGADMVAGDIVRQVSYLLHHENISRVEIVVSPKVASVLLSTRRRHLNTIEERLGKNLDVRVSEAIALDRVDYYGYGRNGEDLALDSLPAKVFPTLEELEQDDFEDEAPAAKGRRRRRRRRSSTPAADATMVALSGELAKELEEIDREEEAEARQAEEARKSRRSRSKKKKARTEPAPEVETKPVRLYVLAKSLGLTAKQILEHFQSLDESDRGDLEIKSHMSMVTPEQSVLIRSWFKTESEEVSEEEGSKPRRRRRRRGGRGRRGRGKSDADRAETTETSGTDETAEASDSDSEDSPPAKKKRRSRRRKSKASSADETVQEAGSETKQVEDDAEGDASPPSTRKKRRRRRKSSKSEQGTEGQDVADSDSSDSDDSKSSGAKKSRRRSGSGRKKKAVTASEETVSEPAGETEPKPKPRRRLYGSRRGLTAADTADLSKDRDE